MNKTSFRHPLIGLTAAVVLLMVYLVEAGGTGFRRRTAARDKPAISKPAGPAAPPVILKPRRAGKTHAVTKADKRANESKKAFLDAYTVFMHPRCRNCHPAGDTPFQGDDSHLHPQGVTRGEDGKGIYANKCSNCHQPQNTELAGEHLPPSHPTWQLPPSHRKMVFEGKSPRALAASFKDSTFTGFKTMERFIEHVETDPLVKHSFTYGTRPPLTHDAFVAKVKEWIQKGAVLPDK
ncbi:hypothetical protein GCM10010967_55400 [Dyadobacter beijingensis]|uniref:Cytochrome c domain-containing protein n=1 Tax=Dyadobacter beijingensis TaxID=365489 RepID=A0ABQ2II24_9BACT|nr:hypothetical protein [Dyadobacter beijingensis]GGN12300.1 hypothetical protein GCM10010967_55400 [Dyadobacter beijingensis]